MYKKISFFLALSAITTAVVSAKVTQEQSAKVQLPEDCFLIDESAAIVDGFQRKHIVCRSDLERTTFVGRKQTLEEIVQDELALQDAMKFKVPIDESVTDRYITALCKQHNLKREDIDVIFKNSGLTPQEGRAELLKLYTKQMMVEQRVLSRIIVPQHEVEEFYKNNPVYKEAKYTVQVAFVPKDGPEAVQEKELKKKLSRSDETGLSWCDPFSLKESDILDDKKFITKMKEGQLSKPIQVSGGFQIFKLAKKRERTLVSLEKRYRQIVDELRVPKMGQSVEKYFAELKRDAHIERLT